MRGKLLFIDDDSVFCNLLVKYFDEEYDVRGFTDPAEAAAYIAENELDVVVSDLSMPGMDGLEVLQRIKSVAPRIDVIIMTAYGRVETAVEAMKRGAYDYIVKPFSTDELSLQLENLFERRRLQDENVHLKKFIDITYRPENIIGESREMKDVYRMIEQVSRTDFQVLISGESGTGKELVARAIHFSGKRNEKPLVSLDCGSMPPELLEREIFGFEKGAFALSASGKASIFEQAGEGTLLLEEIGDLTLDLQGKLAGALDRRSFTRIGSQKVVSFDSVIIATTNKDLAGLRQRGAFREDLFGPNIFSLRVPPLRERKEDIPLLAEHFFSVYKNEFSRPGMKLSPEAVGILKDYEWPGNVRELKGLFARVCLLEEAEVVGPEQIMKRLGTDIPGAEEKERDLIREALGEARGNMTKAAQILNVSYETLRYRMKKHGIRLPKRGTGEIWWD